MDLPRLHHAIRAIRREHARGRLPRAISLIRAAARARRFVERIPRTAYHIRAGLLAAAEQRLPAWRRLARASDLGLPVPVLSACGHGTAEIRYTQLLRYYLDPRSPHGLGARALGAVFGASLATPDAVVEAEVDLGETSTAAGEHGNSLDLLVRTPARALLIEQKLFSGEAVDVGGGIRMTQLERYSRGFAATFPAYAGACDKYFLTPDGRTPAADVTWQPLSHATVIGRLATILEDPTVSSVGRFNILGLLWDLVLGPLCLEESLGALERIAIDATTSPTALLRARLRAGRLVPDLDIDLVLDIVDRCPS